MLTGAVCVYVLFLSGGLSVGLARVLGFPRRGLGAAVRLSAVRVHRKWSHAPTRILTKCCSSPVGGGGSPPERAHVCAFVSVCMCVWMNHFACFGFPVRFVSMRNHQQIPEISSTNYPFVFQAASEASPIAFAKT